VNSRYQMIEDHTCYPNVLDLPEVPDCAVITAAREAVEEIVLDCAKAGVGGAIIFASGYSEPPRKTASLSRSAWPRSRGKLACALSDRTASAW
jgi:acyl-CoA synthetase (NDP forming)